MLRILRITHSRVFNLSSLKKMQRLICMTYVLGTPLHGHEVSQHLAGYSSTDGEERTMAKVVGKVDAPIMADGDLAMSFVLVAQSEDIRSNDKYTNANFQGSRRRNNSLGLDNSLTLMKRTELSIGGTRSWDSITSMTSMRFGVGHWFLGDQLRIGVFGADFKTIRPIDSFLDYDSVTINLRPEVTSASAGFNLKAILNPKTILTGDYSVTRSSERPILRAWAIGIKQYFDNCDCAVHGDAARIINLGKLDTNMANGELTGSQWTLAYLQSLYSKAHARIAYRYAREDEFTRAYGDHLVFGADSYVAAFSQELEGINIGGLERTMLVDVAATRYIHNKSGSATTLEFGGSVKF